MILKLVRTLFQLQNLLASAADYEGCERSSCLSSNPAYAQINQGRKSLNNYFRVQTR